MTDPLELARRILRGDDERAVGPALPASRGPSRAARERSRLKRSLAHFVAWAWPLITGVAFAPNRATDAVIAALQSVADGKVTRLAIAIAPGTGKTTLLACYAAWRLARDPSWRSIHASHAYELAATESRRVRRLVESDAYRAMFPGVVVREDESTVQHWATTSDGRYFAVGTDGALTGRRAHEAVCDDPLNATDRFSKAARDALWAWFTEALSTRLDGDRAPIVVVQQRLDRDDLIGRLIESGGWTLVELPAEDPDTGELLAPNVLPREKLDALKQQIGAATYACQYLQRPSDDSSAAVKRSWWRFHCPAHVAANAPRPAGCDTEHDAVDTPWRFQRVVIAVDMTFGGVKKSNDKCSITVWGSVGAARYLLERWNRRASQLEQRDAIKVLAKKYPDAKVLIEKAAGGPGTIEQLTADGIPSIVPVETGGRGKAERLSLVSPTIEAGNCYLPLGAPWLGEYVEELAGATKHDDDQDSTAYALADLNVTEPPRAWMPWRSEVPAEVAQVQREQQRAFDESIEPDRELAARVLRELPREIDELQRVTGRASSVHAARDRSVLLSDLCCTARALVAGQPVPPHVREAFRAKLRLHAPRCL